MQIDDHSFAVFVYPFSFARSGFQSLVATADRDALAVDAASWPVWERRQFPKDDLLRHVADYLNPPPTVSETACLWTLARSVLTSPRGLGLRAGDTHLCLRHRNTKSDAETIRLVPTGALPFVVDAIDLALFRVGMGYLILRARPCSAAPEDWYDFLNGFRFISRPGQADLLIRRRTGPDAMVSFLPQMIADATGATAGPIQTGHLIRALLGRLEPSAEDWWREVFVPGQMLPFHALFYREAPASERPLVLYRLRNFFRAGQALIPAADDLRLEQRSLLSYAEGMWFSLTLEGGGFAAFDAPNTPFWSETMPMHLREQYFLLFLFALHQRFALMHLSDQVCARWLTDPDPEAETRFSELRETLLEFTARGHFSQIMQREHQHRCFRAWREIFETDRLYQEVGGEIRELHDMLLMRRTERLQRLAEEQRQLMEERDKADQARTEQLGMWFGGIAFLLGFPSLVLSYFDAVTPEHWIGTWQSNLALATVAARHGERSEGA